MRQGSTGEVWNRIEAGGVTVHSQSHHQSIRNYIVYRGTVSFEKTRKIQLENKNEDYGEEPEHEIMDEIEDVQDCEDDEKSVSRRIVIVEDMQELREKEHQEQEA